MEAFAVRQRKDISNNGAISSLAGVSWNHGSVFSSCYSAMLNFWGVTLISSINLTSLKQSLSIVV